MWASKRGFGTDHIFVNSLFKQACAATKSDHRSHFYPGLNHLPYIVYASSEGSGESVHLQCTDSPEPSMLDDAINT